MKQIFITGLGVISVAFFLTACSDSDDGAAGVSGTGNTTLNYSSVVDETAKTITMYSPTCELVNGSAVFNAKGDTSVDSYSIFNNTLTLVDDGDTIVMTGNTSGSVYGAWNVDFSQLGSSTGSAYLGSVVKMTFVVSKSGTSVNVDMSQICYADYFISKMGDDEGVTVTKKNCGQVTISYGTISVTESFYNSFGKLTTIVSYNGKSCTAKNVNQRVSASTCTVANLNAGFILGEMMYSYDNDDEYDTCYSNLFGSEESAALAKTMPNVPAMAKALAKASVK
jgi:hypothetical protein